MPLISVIVPVYKVEPYLRRCVDSILAQTFTDFELILVDDGSPDNCPAICDEYTQKDSRVHVIHQPNGGPSAARNAGIDWAFTHSDSRWLAFIDSDDWVHPVYLETLYHTAVNYGVQIAVCQHSCVSTESDLPSASEGKEYVTDFETLYVQDPELCMPVWCKLYGKELFATLRFPVGKIHEDSFISHIPLFQAGKVAVNEKRLYYYFQRAFSIMHASWTPKRLEELESHDVRLDFLMKNCSQSVVRREVIFYLSVIARHIHTISESAYRQSKYSRYLMKRLRVLLRRFSKSGIIKKQDEDVHAFFDLAFPVSAFIKLWAGHIKSIGFRGVINSIQRRISRIFSKE